MGRWRDQLLLATLTGLVPLSDALEITRTFTTVFPTTAVVTSSSDIAGCTVAPYMQLTCGSGYYNEFGAVWQETCATSFSGGSLILSAEGLSLRVVQQPVLSDLPVAEAFFNSIINMCSLFKGYVTITPGGPYQAAMRSAPSASPCVSTWLVTSTGEVIFTVTPTPTPSTLVSPSSTPIPPSSVRVSSSSSSVPPSSSPVSPSLIRPLTVSSSIILSSPVSSPARPSSTPLIRTSVTSSVSTASPSVIPSGSSSFIFSTPLSSSSSSLTSSSLSSLSSSSTKPSEESSGSTPSASTYTLTTTQAHMITSCAAVVTNCPAHQQTTYLTTETITYVTTLCPEEAQTTASLPTGSMTTIPHTSMIQTTSASSAQSTETAAPPSHMTTSTIYVTEIDVVTACPPSVHNCPAGQKSIYTTTKTVATYATTYLVTTTEYAQVSPSTNPLVQPVTAPTLSLAQPRVSGQGASGYPVMPDALSSSSTQAATHATTMNTVSGKTTSSVTAGAPSSLFTGDAHKMGHSSILLTMAAVISALLFF